MEHGFFHPLCGYWQTTGKPDAISRAAYPAGTVEVPLKPGPDHDYDAETGLWVYTPLPVTRDDVNYERDRRLNKDFEFNGVTYDGDEISQKRLNNARTSALAAIIAGTLASDYRWHGGGVDFFWIAKDNSRIQMDAHMVLALGNAIADRERSLIAAADAIKAMDPIPPDYATNESYWS